MQKSIEHFVFFIERAESNGTCMMVEVSRTVRTRPVCPAELAIQFKPASPGIPLVSAAQPNSVRSVDSLDSFRCSVHLFTFIELFSRCSSVVSLKPRPPLGCFRLRPLVLRNRLDLASFAFALLFAQFTCHFETCLRVARHLLVGPQMDRTNKRRSPPVRVVAA